MILLLMVAAALQERPECRNPGDSDEPLQTSGHALLSGCTKKLEYVGLGRAPAGSFRVEVLFPSTGSKAVREGVKPGQRLVVEEPER